MRTNRTEKWSKVKVIAATTALAICAITLSTSLATSAAGPTIRQGTTSTYGVLAASTVTNTGATTMTGTAGSDIGLSPGTSYTNTGTMTIGGTTNITNSAASIAQTDLVVAYNDLSIPTAVTLTNLDLGGQTLTPGTYASGSSLANSTNLTFDALGDPSAVFIIRAASTVITSSASTMTMVNGAQACNIFWQVGSSATLGTNSTFIGHIYALTSITATTGAKIYGQLLARNAAVTLDNNTIVNDVCITPVVATPTTTTPATATTTRPVATTVKPRPAVTTTQPRPSATTTTTPGTELPSTGNNTGPLVAIGAVLGVLAISAGLIRKRALRRI
jgi:type VI secretion system secreted protein VgrG